MLIVFFFGCGIYPRAVGDIAMTVSGHVPQIGCSNIARSFLAPFTRPAQNGSVRAKGSVGQIDRCVQKGSIKCRVGGS